MIDICHIKHWQLPRAKANRVEDESDRGWHLEPILHEDSYYSLLDSYAWIKGSTYYGEGIWTNDNLVYNAVLDPFYLTRTGGITVDYRGTPNIGENGTLWSSSVLEISSAYTYGVSTHSSGRPLISVCGFLGVSRGLSLRCLTQ